jgi:transcriptional antiterminator RfaH
MSEAYGAAFERSAGMTYWACLVTQPQGELRAAHNLKQQGFDFYIPRISVDTVRRGKKITIHPMMFPRYMFVWIVEQWYALKGTYGVSGIIMQGDRPHPVSNEVIDLVRGFEGSFPNPYKPNAALIVNDGRLRWQHVRFIGMKGSDRVRVLWYWLGRENEVVLPLKAVSPA